MARVTLENVNKIYPSRHGDVQAVKDFSLDVADGEFVSLLGPSGCGKSSTLRMIVGLETVTSGNILFDGRRVNDLEPGARNVAMAFETYALYPNFTIAENLGFPLEVRGDDSATRKRKIEKIAQIMRLEGILDQKPGALSGGEQQRVSLGRALIREPEVFILDEVMSHLDSNLKFEMLLDLKKLHQELGRTMIYVTHDQVEALALSDRVAVMDHALLQQVGTRNQLYATPANIFVADFIGEPPTNFFDLEVRHGTGGTRLVDRAETISFTPAAAVAALLGERGHETVTLGLRPQHLGLAGDGGDENTVRAEVHINEYLGERSILTVKTGDHLYRALVPPGNGAKRNSTVSLRYLAQDLMLFDSETRELIT